MLKGYREKTVKDGELILRWALLSLSWVMSHNATLKIGRVTTHGAVKTGNKQGKMSVDHTTGFQ